MQSGQLLHHTFGRIVYGETMMFNFVIHVLEICIGVILANCLWFAVINNLYPDDD